jgi:hypothetical protein
MEILQYQHNVVKVSLHVIVMSSKPAHTNGHTGRVLPYADATVFRTFTNTSQRQTTDMPRHRNNRFTVQYIVSASCEVSAKCSCGVCSTRNKLKYRRSPSYAASLGDHYVRRCASVFTTRRIGVRLYMRVLFRSYIANCFGRKTKAISVISQSIMTQKAHFRPRTGCIDSDALSYSIVHRYNSINLSFHRVP